MTCLPFRDHHDSFALFSAWRDHHFTARTASSPPSFIRPSRAHVILFCATHVSRHSRRCRHGLHMCLLVQIMVSLSIILLFIN